MADNRVDIEIQLQGAEAAKNGLSSIGESAGKLADSMESTNSHLGEGLGQLTGSVTELGGSFKELGSTIGQVGKTGSAGFALLLPAVGGVIAAGITLYETFKMITGAAQEAEDAEEAMAAAASDLQSKLEALAEKGVVPTTKQLTKFAMMNLKAQRAKEELENVIARTNKLMAKSATATKQVNETTKELAQLQKRHTEALKEASFFNVQHIALQVEIRRVTTRLAEEKRKAAQAEHDYRNAIIKTMPKQIEANKEIAQTEEHYKSLEDQSAESTLARNKELIARLEVLKMARAEAQHQGTALDIQKTYIAEEKAQRLTRLDAIKDKAAELTLTEKQLQTELDGIDQRRVLEGRFAAERRRIYEKQNAEIEAEQAKRRAENDALRAKRLMKERQEQLLTHQIQTEGARRNNASALELLELRYHQQRELAGKNTKALLLVDMRYEREKSTMQEQEAKRRNAQEIALEKKRTAFMLDNQAFDVQMMQDGVDKELALLELKYQREFMMKQHSEEQLTELTRRYNIEREAIQRRALDEQQQEFIEMGKTMLSDIGRNFTTAVYDSLVDTSFDEARRDLNERFQDQVESERKALEQMKGTHAERVEATKEANNRILELQTEYNAARRDIEREEESALPKAIGNTLVALGQQAAVESLMFGAKAVASLFTNPALASNYGIAAGVMAGAAAMAGAGGRALGASGGSGGAGSAPGFSPLGTPQLAAQADERETAETTTAIYNINFGGAVVYDSKQAAEMAFADRITQLQNTRRRGAPRRRF